MRGTNDAMIYVLVWVDGIIIGCRCQDEVDKLRSRFSERFKIDDRGTLYWFLGIQVKQSPGTVTVYQSHYIYDCLEQFGLAECKPVGTPADISAQLSKKGYLEAGSAEAVSMKAEDYRGIVGSFLYIAKQTRPDNLATVTRYLKGSKDLELWYTKEAGGVKLYGSADAD